VALELVSVLSQELPVDDAIHGLLAAFGERLGWDLTCLWVVEPDHEVLRAAGLWVHDAEAHGSFQQATRQAALPLGVGLPGRVWSTGSPASIDELDHDDNFPRAEAAHASALTTGFAFPIEHDGELLGVIEMFRVRPEPIDAEQSAVLAGIGAHLGQYLDRARSRERRARSETRLRLLTQANSLLARWLDYPEALDDLCALLIPELAEACVVDLVEDSALVRVGQAYVDPDHADAAERLEELAPLDTIAAGPMTVVRSGQSLVYEDIGSEEMALGLPDNVPADLIARLSPTSSMIVPLMGRGTAVGTLTLSRRGGRFEDEDRRFAEELGRHVGLAVANSQLFEREHAIAAALQQSLLPPTLPLVPGLEVAARYEPGGTRLAVGGDFYDLFPTAPGQWYAIVGDVCGTGAEAAAITSQVRYTARALASRVAGPRELLAEINLALVDRNDSRFCTVLVAQLAVDDDRVRVVLASGGHPPPVLVSRQGTRLVEVRGTLLGVYDRVVHDEVHLELGPGEALALYTDGVTESRDPEGRQLGEERLVELLHACVDEHAEKTATQVIEAAVHHAAFGPADDIAVLVVRCA
jgi:serine phosphatase RsbU (regulator of sigma subunit)/putative methionine-R-sulfoxide reductase with GAF domain